MPNAEDNYSSAVQVLKVLCSVNSRKESLDLLKDLLQSKFEFIYTHSLLPSIATNNDPPQLSPGSLLHQYAESIKLVLESATQGFTNSHLAITNHTGTPSHDIVKNEVDTINNTSKHYIGFPLFTTDMRLYSHRIHSVISWLLEISTGSDDEDMKKLAQSSDELAAQWDTLMHIHDTTSMIYDRVVNLLHPKHNFAHASLFKLPTSLPSPFTVMANHIASLGFQSQAGWFDQLPLKFGLDESTTALVDSLVSTIKDASGTVNRLADIGDKVTSINVCDAALVLALSTSSLVSATAAILHRSTLGVGITCASLILLAIQSKLSLVDLAKVGFSKIMELFQPKEPTLEMYVAQSSEEALSSLVTLVANIISVVSVGFAPDAKKLSAFVRNVSEFPRFRAGLADQVKANLTLVEKIINFIRVDVLGSTSVSLMEESDPEVRAWMNSCREISDLSIKGQFRICPGNWSRINSLKAMGNTMLSKLGRNTPTALISSINNVLTSLKNMEGSFQRAGLTTRATRQRPTTILIIGPPGTGKSVVTPMLAKSITGETLPVEQLDAYKQNPDTEIYSYNPSSVFYDGYHGQHVAVADDIFAGDPQYNNTNEALEMIKTTSEFAYNLNMPGLEEKGTTFFTSKVIIASTNHTNIETELKRIISFPEAWERRWDFMIVPAPLPQFCKKVAGAVGDAEIIPTDPHLRSLDPSKLPATGYSHNIHEFFLVKSMLKGDIEYATKDQRKISYSYDELVSAVADKYRRHESFATSQSLFAENLITKIVEDRRAKGEEVRQVIMQYQSDDTISVSKIVSTPFSSVKRDEEYRSIVDKFETQSGESTNTPSVSSTDKAFHTLSAPPPSPIIPPTITKSSATREELMNKSRRQRDVIPSAAPRLDAMLRNMIRSDRVPARYHAEIIHCGVTYFSNVVSHIYSKALEGFEGSGPDDEEFVLSLVEDMCESEDFSLRMQEGVNATFTASSIITKSIMSGVFDAWSSLTKQCSDFKETYPKLFSLIEAFTYVAPLVGCVAMLMNYRLGSAVVNEDEDDFASLDDPETEFPFESQFGTSRDLFIKNKRNSKGKKRSAKTRAKFSYENEAPTVRFEAQGGVDELDPNGDDIAASIHRHNSYLLSAGNVGYGSVTFVKGQVCMMPMHFRNKILNRVERETLSLGDTLTLTKVSSDVAKTMSIQAFSECNFWNGDSDRCFMYMPNMPPHRNIVRFFATDSQLHFDRDYHCKVYLPRYDSMHIIFSADVRPIEQLAVSSAGDTLVIMKGFQYLADTRAGDCGALQTIIDPKSKSSKVVGMHVAGLPSKNAGISVVMPRELILTACSKLEPVSQSGATPFELDFKPIGSVSKGIFPPGVSNKKKSIFYGQWGAAHTTPAHLRGFSVDGVRIEPMKSALKHYAGSKISLDPKDHLEAAKHYYGDLIVSSTIEIDLTPVTFEEAVQGRLGDPFFRSIDRSTSAGYPHNTVPGRPPGKQYFFGNSEEIDVTNPIALELKARVEVLSEQVAGGCRPMFVYTDVLKDETRPIDKVKAGSSRLISCSPIEMIILFRMHFMPFVSWYMANHTTNGSAIGLNPFSADWHALALYLMEVGDHCIAGDFSKHDATLGHSVLEAVLDVILRVMSDFPERHKIICRNLWREVTHSRHLCGDILYEWDASLPSGNPLTAIINTIANGLNGRVSFKMVYQGEGNPYVEFRRLVRMVALGDDNLWSVHPDAHEYFHPKALGEALSCLGMKYTDENKEELGTHFKPLTCVSFLKRTFRYEPLVGRYVAPLSMSTIKEMPYWTNKGSAERIHTLDTFDSAIIELSLHGKQVFDSVSGRMLSAARKIRHVPDYSEWSECLLKAAECENKF